MVFVDHLSEISLGDLAQMVQTILRQLYSVVSLASTSAQLFRARVRRPLRTGRLCAMVGLVALACQEQWLTSNQGDHAVKRVLGHAHGHGSFHRDFSMT